VLLLISFSQFTNRKLTFENIDWDFFDHFTNFLIDEKEMSNNTIHKLNGYFKTFMSWSLTRKYHTNLEYQSFSFKSYDPIVYALNENELDRIINLDLSDNLRLSKVRDILVFSCHTGQRISDILNISKDNFIEEGDNYFLRLKTQKTKEFVNILLSKTAQEIYKRYFTSGEGFLQISSVKYNKHLKNLAKMAEIDTPITKYKYSGNKRTEETKPKYEFVASHIGRKTFITLSLEKGMRPEVLMKIVGIRDYKTLKKYIEITDRAKVNEMTKFWGKE
jgi:site-specific recombinase XerD